MKKINKLGLVSMILLVGCNSTNEVTTPSEVTTPANTTVVETTTAQQEGTLKIHNVVQYLGYNSIEIRKYMDGVEDKSLDLYYYIVDDTICSIENDYVTGLKEGNTQVFASTASGQEVEFTVRIKKGEDFLYDRDVNSRIAAYKDRAYSPKNPTIFVGDSFFDEMTFWTSFYNDFDGLPVYSPAISGTQTTHWVHMRDKLIKAFNPKNIVLHIGTNDVNDTSINMNVQQYYDQITYFLDLLCKENPDVMIYFLGIENRNNHAGGKNEYSTRVTQKIQEEFAVQYENFVYIDSPAVFNKDLDTYICADDIHPSRVGYEWYIKTLKEMVEF